jgi:hypothetical protein
LGLRQGWELISPILHNTQNATYLWHVTNSKGITIPDSTMFERRYKQYPHPFSCSPRGGNSPYYLF